MENETQFEKQNNTIHFETNEIEVDEAIICVVFATIIQLIGNGFLSLIIVYEKCTMDAQKRTIINQLVSHACLWLIFYNLVGISITTYIIIVNDAGKFQKRKKYSKA